MVTFSQRPVTERLILDGQQRLTTLTQVLKLYGPVKTFNEKHDEIEGYYYIDIEQALASETLDDVFVAVPADKKLKTDFYRVVTLDLSTPELPIYAFYLHSNT